MTARAAQTCAFSIAWLVSSGVSAAPAVCADYLAQALALNSEVQTMIRTALDERIDVSGQSCRFRSEAWSVREEKHQAWCAGKEDAAVEQRLQQMSGELKSCAAELDTRRHPAASAAAPLPRAQSDADTEAPAPVAPDGGVSFSSSELGIQVVAATWGANCGVQPENDTQSVSSACDGYSQSCEHLVDTTLLRDPAPGCDKTYVAEWRCGQDPTTRRAQARPRLDIIPTAAALFVTLQCGN